MRGSACSRLVISSVNKHWEVLVELANAMGVLPLSFKVLPFVFALCLIDEVPSPLFCH